MEQIYAIFLAFKGMLFTLMQDEVTTDKITYKTSPISNYIVEYVTQGYFMLTMNME